MEGLLIAEQLRELAPLLPAERLAWRFPDDRTAVLPLLEGRSLWLGSRPPRPYLALKEGAPEALKPRTPFQQQLASRAVGPLLAATQPARDRVLRLTFGTSEGFVPVPGVELVAELTGRNSNLVLVEGGRMIGVERQVLADRNRYRELRVGLDYRPPPPYDKLDPIGAPLESIAAALRGSRLAQVASVVDGVGPELTAALKAAAAADGVAADTKLDGDALAHAAHLVAEAAQRPSAFLARWGGVLDPMNAAREERQTLALDKLERLLKKELRLARRKVSDAVTAVSAGEEAGELRRQGDLLLARAAAVPAGAEQVTLPGFDGTEETLTLDPRLDAAGNARARYDQARRRAARAQRALRELPALEAAADAAQAALEAAATLPAGEVRARLQAAESGAAQADRRSAMPGIRFQGPHGFEVVVGRNARDNDKVTFGVARSRDLWFHAQGYRGSHVVVRSGGKEVPFDTVLFAARLAAGHSEAGREDRVAVDYTERKNVWRPKGGAPGAVNFAHHRTVVVAPARDDAGARG